MPDNKAEQTPGSRERGGWRLRNWRLRTKVLAVLLIPAVTALVLAGLRGVTELQRQQSLQLTATQVDVTGEISTVVNRLQRERFLAVAKTASGTPGTDAGLQQQNAQVDAAVVDLREAASTLRGEDAAVRNRYDQGLQRLESLDAVRSAVNGTAYPPIAVYDVYSSIISDLVQLGRQVNAAVTDRQLLRSSDVLQSLSEAKDYASRLDAVLQIASTGQQFPTGLLDEARASQASFEAAQTAFESNASTQERQLYSDTVSGPEVDSRERLAQTAFSRADADDPLSIDPAELSTASAATSDKLRSVQFKLLDQLRGNATALADSAQQSALRDAAIVLAALLAALVLLVLVIRSLLRPLRTLRTSALDLAYTRLPDEVDQILADPNPMEASKEVVRPVPVYSREETGEVARSFDEVHARAVELAAEQALLRESVNAMFVNLSRRSQTLVERQLALIDRLEADEQDPDQLSSLFELDHLATRMRRNSENLLVLSGTDLGRRLNKGVPLNDVIGAAVSEIEQYTRVQVSQAPDYVVAGSVVNDLVHLIAELLDNATLFSNPETQVTVRAAKVRSGGIGIEVTDKGVGIPDAELEALNQRLGDPPELDVSVSRRMGLFVVARLAKRHGVRVQLRENEDLEGGVVAKVVIPQHLVNPGESLPTTDSDYPLAEEPSTAGQTGAFAAVPDSADEHTSPAMASAGLAKAFGGGQGASANGGQSRERADAIGREPLDSGQNGYRPQPEDLDHELPAEDEDQAFDEQETRLTGARDQQEKAAEMDVPTDRLPIYEAVLSQWFSTDPDPAGWQAGQQANGVGAQAAPAAPDDQAAPGGLPKRVPGGNAAEPALAEPPAGAAAWNSPADQGWEAAEALSTPVDEVTSAGLPKRRPKAHLVPGSAAPRPAESAPPQAAETTAATPSGPAKRMPATVPRGADAVRGRMSSLQQGVRRGRHARLDQDDDSVTSDSLAAESRHHEELE